MTQAIAKQTAKANSRNLVKEIDLDGLDPEDKALTVAQLGQVRKYVKNVAGNTTAINSLTQCGNKHLKPALLREELEELVANGQAALAAIDALPMAS